MTEMMHATEMELCMSCAKTSLHNQSCSSIVSATQLMDASTKQSSLLFLRACFGYSRDQAPNKHSSGIRQSTAGTAAGSTAGTAAEEPPRGLTTLAAMIAYETNATFLPTILNITGFNLFCQFTKDSIVIPEQMLAQHKQHFVEIHDVQKPS